MHSMPCIIMNGLLHMTLGDYCRISLKVQQHMCALKFDKCCKMAHEV